MISNWIYACLFITVTYLYHVWVFRELRLRGGGFRFWLKLQKTDKLPPWAPWTSLSLPSTPHPHRDSQFENLCSIVAFNLQMQSAQSEMKCKRKHNKIKQCEPSCAAQLILFSVVSKRRYKHTVHKGITWLHIHTHHHWHTGTCTGSAKDYQNSSTTPPPPLCGSITLQTLAFPCPTEGGPLPETPSNKSSRLLLAALCLGFPRSKCCLLSVSPSLPHSFPPASSWK